MKLKLPAVKLLLGFFIFCNILALALIYVYPFNFLNDTTGVLIKVFKALMLILVVNIDVALIDKFYKRYITGVLV